MNNSYLLMLLPMLMSKSKGNKSANDLFNSDILMKFAESNMGNNPMLSMMTAMMRSKPEKKQQPDVGNIFGEDVENILKLLISINDKNNSTISKPVYSESTEN